jgi:dihydroceramidase
MDGRHVRWLPDVLTNFKHHRWHILTGLGVYYFIVVIEYLRLYTSDPKLADQTNPHIVLSWTSALHLPYMQIFPRMDMKVDRSR